MTPHKISKEVRRSIQVLYSKLRATAQAALAEQAPIAIIKEIVSALDAIDRSMTPDDEENATSLAERGERALKAFSYWRQRGSKTG